MIILCCNFEGRPQGQTQSNRGRPPPKREPNNTQLELEYEPTISTLASPIPFVSLLTTNHGRRVAALAADRHLQSQGVSAENYHGVAREAGLPLRPRLPDSYPG